jgi:hypothetical protein
MAHAAPTACFLAARRPLSRRTAARLTGSHPAAWNPARSTFGALAPARGAEHAAGLQSTARLVSSVRSRGQLGANARARSQRHPIALQCNQATPATLDGPKPTPPAAAPRASAGGAPEWRCGTWTPPWRARTPPPPWPSSGRGRGGRSAAAWPAPRSPRPAGPARRVGETAVGCQDVSCVLHWYGGTALVGGSHGCSETLRKRGRVEPWGAGRLRLTQGANNMIG